MTKSKAVVVGAVLHTLDLIAIRQSEISYMRAEPAAQNDSVELQSANDALTGSAHRADAAL